MAVNIAPQARLQFTDANGLPIVGGKLFTYLAGSSTKQSTFTTSTGASSNTNPIILDSAGRTPSGVWLTSGISYKFILAPATDTDPPTSPIFTEDNITGINDALVNNFNQWIVKTNTPTFISTTSFSLVGDQTTDFHVGRRIKTVNSGGTFYATILTSVFTTLTTITLTMDSGVLDTGISSVEIGLLTVTNSSVPNASETYSGKAQIATQAIVNTGTNDLQFVTPLKLKTLVDAREAAVMQFSTASGTVPDSTTRYMGMAIVSTVDADAWIRVPYACTVRNLHTQVPGSATGTRTYTVMVNGVASSITAAASGATTQAQDTTNTATLAAGDRLSIRIVTSGGSDVVTHNATVKLISL